MATSRAGTRIGPMAYGALLARLRRFGVEEKAASSGTLRKLERPGKGEAGKPVFTTLNIRRASDEICPPVIRSILTRLRISREEWLSD